MSFKFVQLFILMPKFRLKLFVITFPILLLLGYTEWFYRHVPNNYTVKKQYIDAHAQEIEVLLLGDSHCFYGLNPDYFSERTFNLSNISQTIYFDKLLFDKYIDQLPKLRKVVFCLEYANLSQKDNTQEDLWRKYFYQAFMDLTVPLIQRYDAKQYVLSLNQGILKTIKLMLRYFSTGSITDCKPNGWGINYTFENRTKPSLSATRRWQQNEDNSLDFSVNTHRLDSMITVCKQRNMQVFIVLLPVSKAFYHLLNPEKTAKIKQTCQRFTRQNPQNVHYLNLLQAPIFSDNDFYDADHLNDSGAVKCSRIVNDFLNK